MATDHPTAPTAIGQGTDADIGSNWRRIHTGGAHAR